MAGSDGGVSDRIMFRVSMAVETRHAVTIRRVPRDEATVTRIAPVDGPVAYRDNQGVPWVGGAWKQSCDGR